VELKLNGTHHFLAYADDVNPLGDNVDTSEILILHGYCSKVCG
jgi:hypothetical protein